MVEFSVVNDEPVYTGTVKTCTYHTALSGAALLLALLNENRAKNRALATFTGETPDWAFTEERNLVIAHKGPLSFEQRIVLDALAVKVLLVRA